MTILEDALQEYQEKREYPSRYNWVLVCRYDGYYEAQPGDECPKCVGATWSSATGAHVNSVEHIAAKHGLPVSVLRNAVAVWKISHPSQRLLRPLDLETELEPEAPIEVINETEIGWKTLSLSIDNEGERCLVSANGNGEFIWVPYQTMRAKCCSPEAKEGWACMRDMCGCGFYFFWYPTPAREYNAQRQVVVRCELGGMILEHDLGCRAEYASITGILFREGGENLAKIASALYGVPVIDDNGEEHVWTATPATSAS